MNINNLDKIPNEAKEIVGVLNQHGFSAYVVGGFVRDLLLNKEPHDCDICTSATPKQIEECFSQIDGAHFIETGMKHGTVTVVLDCAQPIEVTTYRIDGNYLDNRHPDSVTFTDNILEDLKRRDFTANAFALNPLDGKLITLMDNQLLDLQLGIIRCVGDPDTRFQEDALRMLRAIRFSAQLGFSIEDKTFKAIKDNAALIQNISKERIRDELTKIVCSDNPQMLEFLSLTGLDTYIIPDITKMLECKQHNKYHYTDVMHHTFDVMKMLPKDSFTLRWAGFFHDIGKPYCVSVDDEGWEHFYNHPDISAERAKQYMLDLKFDNDSIDTIYKLVKYHDREIGTKVSMKSFKKIVNLVGVDLFPDFLKLRVADAYAHKLNVGIGFAIESISSAKDKYENLLLKPQPMKISDLALNGNDLKAMGLEGVQIGITLKELLEYVLENPEKNTKEDLTNKVNLIKR
jgi:tRNA nucleotidyltransferase (CCA-adding enzyme)